MALTYSYRKILKDFIYELDGVEEDEFDERIDNLLIGLELYGYKIVGKDNESTM